MTQDQELQQAKKILLGGGVVGLPTETVYGLAASIQSEEGLRKIFAIKDRPFFDPLIVHIASANQRSQVARDWPPAAEALAKKFWPGPLTLVLPKNPSINSVITAGLDTVGVRMPAHPAARALISLMETPLAAPSANKFGKTSPTKAEHVRDSFRDENLFVIEGGPSEVGLESTVVRLSSSGGPAEILRPGAITQRQIEDTLKAAGLDMPVVRAESSASPGHTPQHYMPDLPLVIIEAEGPRIPAEKQKKIFDDFQLSSSAHGVELLLDTSPKLAARSLYSKMRECAEQNFDFIYVFRTKYRTGDLWDAIWDRVDRAASGKY